MNDLETLLLGDRSWPFLFECALRAAVMVIIMLLLFKLTGKKEVRQFSILELVVLIGLGSALGDPMFYAEVGILPAAVVILVVLLMYRIMNHWTNRQPRVGQWLAGDVVTVFRNGMIDREALDKEGWSVEEFFGDLRVAHVEHLGQIHSAHVEVDGELSIFFRPPDQVEFGLPIAPAKLKLACTPAALPPGPASCGRCGHTEMSSTDLGYCGNCSNDKWLPSMDSERIA